MLENAHIPLNASSSANIDIQFGLEKDHKEKPEASSSRINTTQGAKKALNGVWAPLREISFY